MNIRPVTEADHDTVRALVDSYNEEFWRRPFPVFPLPDEWLREGRLLLAELEGEVVGLARGELRHGLGRVSLVYVPANRRRSGIGTALLRGSAERRCTERCPRDNGARSQRLKPPHGE